ncbi:MAG: hypothetical protein U9Q97_03270 [Acidobacteriota bacterium]|nr:hypothetical protein [Acidobacteriota bacterium]
MGLFEDIGETIGNAFSALAEFFGDAFEAMIGSVIGSIHFLGSTIAKNMINEMKGSETDLKADLKAMMVELEKEKALGVEDVINKTLDYTGPAAVGQGTLYLNILFETLIENLHDDELFANVSEICTLGQVEGVRSYLNVLNQAYAMPDLCNKKKMMEYDAAFMLPYQKELNAKYQNAIAGPSDLVTFGLREVWAPDRRPELLEEDAPNDYYDYMKQTGFPKDRAADYWAAHWVLPSVLQLNEMLHRGIIDDATWDRFIKYNDYDPTVRPWLKAISHNLYTRVDTRRMWDLRVLKEYELLENYKGLGYDQEHAEKMVTWTKVYIAAGDIRSKYSKGWITAEQAKGEFIAAGLPADRADEYLKTMISAEEENRTANERDLTKTDIARSVQKGLITRDVGVEKLMELGYEEDEADTILDIRLTNMTSTEIEKDRELSKYDIISGITERVFTEAQGLQMLQNLGYSAENAQYIMDIRVPPKKYGVFRRERDLTKAEIVKGVKKQLLPWNQGVTMLETMGYDKSESEYILMVNLQAATGSPEKWSEFQDMVNKGRKATGQKVKNIPKVITELEDKITKKEAQLEKSKKEEKPKEELEEIEKDLRLFKRQHRQKVEKYQASL